MDEASKRIADQIRGELEAGRSEFHTLLEAVSAGRWQQRSKNPAWTNGQLLFHIALGFFLVVPLVWIMRIFAALPPVFSRVFARCLNFSTPLFNWINAIGPKFAARFFSSRRLSRTFDAVFALILRSVNGIRPGEWSRGMHYPIKWEPRFADFMTFETLFRYPTVHLRHHAKDLIRPGI